MLNKIICKTIFLGIVVLSLVVSSTAKTELSPNDFDSTLPKWLAFIGFKGDVVEYQKIYDDNGYIDYFRILLQESPPPPESKARTGAKIFIEVTDNEAYEFAHLKIIEKDIRTFPLMKADWIARYAISYTLKNVSKLLGLQAKTEKVRPGLYKVTIDPAKSSEPSRYRFSQVEIFYEVKDLFLSIDMTLKGEKNYLILSYAKSELNGILRALENGNFPGATSEILTSGVGRESSDYLIRDLLKVPELLHGKTSELEHSPEQEALEEALEAEFQ